MRLRFRSHQKAKSPESKDRSNGNVFSDLYSKEGDTEVGLACVSELKHKEWCHMHPSKSELLEDNAPLTMAF